MVAFLLAARSCLPVGKPFLRKHPKDYKTFVDGYSNSHYGPLYPRRVRAPGLHPAQNRCLVGRVPPPGLPVLSTMRIAGAESGLFWCPPSVITSLVINGCHRLRLA